MDIVSKAILRSQNRARAALFYGALGAVAFAFAPFAVATAQTETDAQTVAGDQLQEIVVSAQRRTQSLQDVPVSVQVIQQDNLVRANITSVVALAEQIPSVHVFASGRSSNFYIRGTGSGESQSFDQSVGTFIDDVYHGRSRLSGATFVDLERVEVLKGPQTTFFGNNAIAGAFNIVTHKPDPFANGWIRGLISPTSGENGGQYALEGAVNVPLADEWAMRVAGTVNGMRGYLKNIVTDDYAPRKQNVAGRATLRYTPASGLDVTLKGEYSSAKNKGGLVLRSVNCPPAAPFAAAGFCAANLAAFGSVPSLRSSDYIASDGNRSDLDTGELTLGVSYPIGDVTLASTSSYNGYNFIVNVDNDGTPRRLFTVSGPERYRQFSQEFRLSSSTGGAIDYIAGLYYQHDELRITQQANFFFVTPASYPALAAIGSSVPFGQDVRANQDENVYSAFASVTWNVDDRFSVTGGLRGSIVEKKFDWSLNYGTATQDYGGVVPFAPAAAALAPAILNRFGTIGAVSLDRSDEALMPSARLQYKVNDDVMLYASYTRGFKAGGFSVAETSANPVNYPFDPEYVNAYEIGLKSELLDRTLLLNVAAFRNDFSDLQVVIQGQGPSGGLVNFVRNAAQSRSQGVELETTWIASREFRISANGTYLDSKYVRYPNAGATYLQQFLFMQANPGQPASNAVQDLSGRPTLFAPKWSGSVTGTLELPVAQSLRFIAEGTAIFSSSYNTYSTLDPLTRQPGYARVDARITLETDDGNWGIDLIGKNLTNSIIRTFSGQQPNSFGSFYQDREQLRNIAIQVRHKF